MLAPPFQEYSIQPLLKQHVCSFPKILRESFYTPSNGFFSQAFACRQPAAATVLRLRGIIPYSQAQNSYKHPFSKPRSRHLFYPMHCMVYHNILEGGRIRLVKPPSAPYLLHPNKAVPVINWSIRSVTIPPVDKSGLKSPDSRKIKEEKYIPANVNQHKIKGSVYSVS